MACHAMLCVSIKSSVRSSVLLCVYSEQEDAGSGDTSLALTLSVSGQILILRGPSLLSMYRSRLFPRLPITWSCHCQYQSISEVLPGLEPNRHSMTGHTCAWKIFQHPNVRALYSSFHGLMCCCHVIFRPLFTMYSVQPNPPVGEA